jgi:hypothetical protein
MMLVKTEYYHKQPPNKEKPGLSPGFALTGLVTGPIPYLLANDNRGNIPGSLWLPSPLLKPESQSLGLEKQPKVILCPYLLS